MCCSTKYLLSENLSPYKFYEWRLILYITEWGKESTTKFVPIGDQILLNLTSRSYI